MATDNKKKIDDKVNKGIQKTNDENGNLQNAKSTEIETLLRKYEPQMYQALPKFLTPDRLIQMAVTLTVHNPKLLDCTKKSLVGAVMQAAILGFKPVSQLGECYFIPYKRNYKENGDWKSVLEVQFQIGYQGYITLGYRSTFLKDLSAEAVYENDIFDFEYGTSKFLKHKFDISAPRGKRKCYYMLANLRNGGQVFKILSLSDVEMLRLRSPLQEAGKEPAGAWKLDYGAMGKAKVIKQGCKFLPKDEILQVALASDEGVISIDAFKPTQAGEIDIDKIEYPKDAEAVEESMQSNAFDYDTSEEK